MNNALRFAIILSLLPVNLTSAQQFRLQTIRTDTKFSACSVFDVNGDGKLDIYSGMWWYEAPTWKRHFVRNVRQIRGRFDGYSSLPWDVNGDGHKDVVAVNYRSRSLYWLQNPGKFPNPWKKNVIAVPGAMETGRMVDVDGDGRLDLLPNGVKFAAWWELKAASDQPQWVRHDLPQEVGGHGVGFGDIDGDGRGDIVGPRGWLQAPKDRRRGRWLWRPEFRLHRDCSIPILVADVDGDGDGDVIWGRGHGFGLYWLEQTKAGGKRQWTRHVIDTSWSQPHSLLLADLDNDGKSELIAGKRFMGHDGKDLGEYDPLIVCSYKFLPSSRTWSRNLISTDQPAGFGLDPKVIDLDRDGDLDLVASGRSGLFVLENLLKAERRAPATLPPRRALITDHTEVMKFPHINGKTRPVRSRSDWALRRAAIVQGLERAMGPLPGPAQRVPLNVRVLKRVSTPMYERQRISYQAEPGDRVPAYLLIPHRRKERAAAMLCLHQTTGIGKGEPAGLGGLPNLRYAHELASRGYVCIVPDYPSFGDYPYNFAQKGKHYRSGSMKAIWNNLRAVDLLDAMPEVDPDRIGCIGHSLGGHNALFTAVFDQRLKAVVTSCGFTAFHHYYGGRLKGWTSNRYMPRINNLYKNDPNQVPFDFHEIVAALAPRGIFVNAPVHDGNFDIVGVDKVMVEARRVYKLYNATEKMAVYYPMANHDFPTPIRQKAYAWLDRLFQKK